jgi:hypothetical protein
MDRQTVFRPTAKAELKALKNALDNTSHGPKVVAARKHYLEAMIALVAKDDARCRRELDAAVRSYYLGSGELST